MDNPREDLEWQGELEKEIVSYLKEGITEWGQKVVNIGLKGEEKQHWIDVYKREIFKLIKELNNDATEYEEVTIVKIKHLKAEYASLCSYLKVPQKRYSLRKYSLFDYRDLLMQKVASLNVMKEKHVKQVNQLISKEKELCKILGVTTKGFEFENIEKFEEYISKLDDEIYRRSEKFVNYKCEILDFIDVLDIKEIDDFYTNLLVADENSVEYSEENLKKLANYHKFLKKQVDTIKANVAVLKNKIMKLWAITMEDQFYQKRFMVHFNKINNNTCEELQKEICRLEQIKKDNFEMIIKNIRDEIIEFWDKCKFTQDERQLFKHAHYFEYDDAFLEAHQDYLSSLKELHQNNSEIFALIDKLETCCKDFYEKSNKYLNPNDKYKNRGAGLLQDEKEKNLLKKKINKYEERINNCINESFKSIANIDFNGCHVKKYVENLFVQNQFIKNPNSTKKYGIKSLNLSTASERSCGSSSKSPLYSTKICSELKTNTNTTINSKKALFNPPNTNGKENLDDVSLLVYSKFKESSKVNSTFYKSSKSIRDNPIKKAKIKYTTKHKRTERYLKAKRGVSIVSEIFKGVKLIEDTSDVDLVP